MDWRPKALIWLHPETDIHDRRRVWFAKEIEEKDEKGNKKGKIKVVNVPFVVPEDPDCDPFYLLRGELKAREDIDGDDVVLVVGKGRKKEEYRKGDVLGWDDYTFKKRLVPQQDVVFAAILSKNAKDDRPKKLKVQVIAAAKTLGREINKEIEVEIDENGEERGNPLFTPYPFRIEYDETASGTDMYSASARPAIESDDELDELFGTDLPDMEDELKIADADAVYSMLKAALVVDLEIPEPKGATFPGRTRGGDQVEDPPEAEEKADDEPDDEKEERAAREKAAEVAKKKKEAAAKKSADARKKAAEAKKAAEEAEAEAEDLAAAEAKKKVAAKAEKPKTTRKRKVAVEPDPPKDDVKVPEDYDDPGPRPDEKNVGWWPDREKGEAYDLCPKCDRPVREDDQKCPHKDCEVSFAPVGDAF